MKSLFISAGQTYIAPSGKHYIAKHAERILLSCVQCDCRNSDDCSEAPCGGIYFRLKKKSILCKLGIHKHVVRKGKSTSTYYRCMRGCGHIHHSFSNVSEVVNVDLSKYPSDIDTVGTCANCGVEFHIHKPILSQKSDSFNGPASSLETKQP